MAKVRSSFFLHMLYFYCISHILFLSLSFILFIYFVCGFFLWPVVDSKARVGSPWDRETCFFTLDMAISLKLESATPKFTISTNIQHVPANHTSQAHFHGEVISAGLIVIYVWQQVFACLHSDRRRAILLFLQTRLFRGIHLSQVNPDLFFFQ